MRDWIEVCKSAASGRKDLTKDVSIFKLKIILLILF